MRTNINKFFQKNKNILNKLYKTQNGEGIMQFACCLHTWL